MSDPSPPVITLQIPAETQAAFGALIELVKGSESMNNEERQYWINILPVMTPEQIKNLEDILSSEKKQLAAIDEKYAKKGVNISTEDIEKKMRGKNEQRRKAEMAEAHSEESTEQDILSKIQSL